jgi:primase-polymerase (primpol)-like protein
MATPRIIVPDSLAELDRWLLWRSEIRNGEPTKVPYSAPGRVASPTRPADWLTFEQATQALERYPKHWSGIGFVFSSADGVVGIDLDDSLDVAGQPKLWAQGYIERFADTYTEVSPSGTGIKIFAKGTVPKGLGKVLMMGKGRKDGIEMYSTGRFFAVTGQRFRGAPLEIEDHSADVLRMYHMLTGEKSCQQKQRCRVPAEGKIAAGNRHNALVSIAGVLRWRGICDEGIEACLLAINTYQCGEPKPAEEVLKIVRDSRNWRQAQ